MPVIKSQVDAASEEFAANARAMRGLVDDLQAKLREASLGGGDDARIKHLKREKMLPRDRIAALGTNLLSVYALSNWSVYGTTSASQAAALSLTQCLRAEFAGSGVKVVNVLFGPLEESWRQPLPPPKVTPQRLADTVIHALTEGIENVTLGPVAEDVVRRYKEDPFVLERELAQLQPGL